MNLVIQLQHTDLLPSSEIITVPGGQFVALTRGEDYEIDYKNGLLTVLPTGIIPSLPGATSEESLPLDITYRRKVDFLEELTLESHIEVFDEVAQVAEDFELRVANGPVLDVFRAFNKTTGEEYAVDSFHTNTIFISGEAAPRVVSLPNLSALERERRISDNTFIVDLGLDVTTELKPVKDHPIVTSAFVQARTAFRQLIKSGIDPLVSEYVIEITNNFDGIELFTGSTILRRSTIQLIEDVHYTVVSDVINMTLTITLTADGQTLINTNSLFYRLNKRFTVRDASVFDVEGNIEDDEHRIEIAERFVKETTTFSADNKASLTKLRPFLQIGQEVDQVVFPTLVVTNRSGTITFIEGEDYIIDTAFLQLIRLDSSTRLLHMQVVDVAYTDVESFSWTGTMMQDTVLVDYDYGTNSINWTPSFEDEETQEEQVLAQSTRFFSLNKFPVDENVTVQRTLDSGARVQNIKVLAVNPSTRQVEIEPAPESATYTVSYIARRQLITPNSNYFVTYRYGARKRALLDNFAALLGLTTGTVVRQEQFDFINGQSNIVLARPPADVDRVNIFRTGDPDMDPQATPTSFDASTNLLRFTPVINADNYTVEYPVSGWETEQLRTAIIALLQSFILGPTQQSLIALVTAMTGIEPEVIEALSNGFLLTNGEDSDFLAPLAPRASPELSDGRSSIEFAPSRFANGVSLREANGAYIKYGALNNVRVEEGTVEFLTGTFWNGDDQKSHYFFDLMGTDDFTNRITIYKNKGGLLVFEIRDSKSNLRRITTDIRRIVRNEVLLLSEGQSSVQLTHTPANTVIDLDGDGQQDIFGANPTELVITPVFRGPQGLGLSIFTIVRIPNTADYTVKATHKDRAHRLRSLATIYEKFDAKLAIFTELSFMQGSQLHDNVLLELKERGHDVHILIDLPQAVISDEDRDLYILERRNALDALGIQAGKSDGIAGGYEIDHFASVFPALGLDMALAYKDPVTGDTLTDRTDVFRADIGPDFSIPNPEGQLVYLPGDNDIQFQKAPMIVQSFIPITNSLLTAINRAKPDVINSWYFEIDIDDFRSAEIVLFEQWLSSTVAPLVQAGQVAWRTPSQTLQAFREFEEFLRINRNRVRFVTEPYGYAPYGYGGTQLIRALTWDEVTNTLTFDPAEKGGFHLFSYVSGFAKYEEAEHNIMVTWKLHTDDAQPAMVRMFLDGELVNHKIFGDL